MSPIRSRSAFAETLTVSAYWRCSGVSWVSRSSSVIPITPFSGVRISWLMLARNSLFAREAASAAFLATRSASALRAAVTSRITTTPPRITPASSRSGLPVSLIDGAVRVSRALRTMISTSSVASPRSAPARSAGRPGVAVSPVGQEDAPRTSPRSYRRCGVAPSR